MDKSHFNPDRFALFGRVHIVGIGGIGMSGIAEVMHVMGYEVQGSDLGDNANTKRLRDMGMKVVVGHAAENIENAGVVTISSAVAADNPEIVAARENHIPVVRRAEMLAELMRLKPCITIAGTHGKTTTTSLTAAMLDAAGLDPTVINGGIINAYGTNARLGQGDWMVVEADESDGTFVRLPATIGIVTNIDPEHLDHYGDFDGLRAAFDSYIANIPFYGVGIVCLDHAEVQALVGACDRPPSHNLWAERTGRFARRQYSRRRAEAAFRYCLSRPAQRCRYGDWICACPMAGKHNLQNALAAIAAGLELGANADTVAKALADFSGVKRRFSRCWRARRKYPHF